MIRKNLLILSLAVSGLQAMDHQAVDRQLREPLVDRELQAPASPDAQAIESSPAQTPVVAVPCETARRSAVQPRLSCWRRAQESLRLCEYSIADSWRGLSQGTRDTVITSALLTTALVASSEDIWGYNDLFPALVQTAMGVAMGVGPLAKYDFWPKVLAAGVEVPVDVTANWFLARAGQMYCRHTGFFAMTMGILGLTSVRVEMRKRAAVKEVRGWTLHELVLAMNVAPRVIDEMRRLEREQREPATVTQRISIIRSLYEQDARAAGWPVVDIERRCLQVEKIMAWTDLGALPKIHEVLKAKLTKAQSQEAV